MNGMNGMNGSYSQSFGDILDDSWQIFADWDATDPFDVGAE